MFELPGQKISGLRIFCFSVLMLMAAGCSDVQDQPLTPAIPVNDPLPEEFDPASEGSYKDMNGDGLYHFVADCHDFRNAFNNRMLIRDIISTPNSGDQSVVFTGSTGPDSFADGDNVYDGICEVCHTQTSLHLNSSAGDHSSALHC